MLTRAEYIFIDGKNNNQTDSSLNIVNPGNLYHILCHIMGRLIYS